MKRSGSTKNKRKLRGWSHSRNKSRSETEADDSIACGMGALTDDTKQLTTTQLRKENSMKVPFLAECATVLLHKF